ILLAVVFWQRYPTPCLFTLIAAGLLLVLAVGQTLLNQYLIEAYRDWGWGHERLEWVFGAGTLVSRVLRATAVGLLLVAVFIGRRGGQRTGFPPEPQPPWPTPKLTGLPGDQGITTRPGR